MKTIKFFIISSIVVLFCNCGGTSTIDGTKDCLINVDWVYPNSSNPQSAWKFSSDGTFNFSTGAFGGMTAYGTWEVNSPSKISISYQSSTTGQLPSNQVLTLDDCSTLRVGSTKYTK